jgi:hypothetical protein
MARQHAAPLLGLPIGLDRHIAEDDLLTLVVATLSNEHLEGPYLVAAHRAHVTAGDGQRYRLHVCPRWQRRWRHDGRALQPGADLQCPTLDGVDRREITGREEGRPQSASAAVTSTVPNNDRSLPCPPILQRPLPPNIEGQRRRTWQGSSACT